MPTIAIDVSGPVETREQLLAGVAEVSRAGDVECLVVGDATRIQGILDHVSYDPERIALLESGEGSARDGTPETLDTGLQAVADARAQALVTPASADLCVRAGARRLALLPGVRRPAVGFVYPRLVATADHNRFALLLDASGADGGLDDRAALAGLGCAYLRGVSDVASPRVGVLGAEPPGGGEAVELGRRLARFPGCTFVGIVSGHDLVHDVADVIVCTGVVGRVARELLETVAALLDEEQVARSWRGGLRLFHGRDRLHPLADHAGYQGAPVLGLSHLVLRCEGRVDPRSVGAAIRGAARAVRDGVQAEMVQVAAAVGGA